MPHLVAYTASICARSLQNILSGICSVKLTTTQFSACLLANLLFCFGCKQNDAQLANALKQLAISNQIYISERRSDSTGIDQWIAGPRTWKELCASNDYLTDVVPVLKQNKIVVCWGYSYKRRKILLADDSGPYSTLDLIFAYPEHALSDGGPVVFWDGRVIQMSAAELNKKLKEQGDDYLSSFS